MEKNTTKKVLTLTAGLAGAAGLAAIAVAPNTTHAATTGTVTYHEGATTVWGSPAFNTQSVQRYVVYNQSINVIGQKIVNGTTWYQIGTNEWIPDLYLRVAGTKTDDAANSTSSTTTSAAANSKAENTSLTVTYTSGAVTIWNGTNYTSPSGQYLTTDDSNVTAVASTTVGGETWYRLSNGGYVPARFVAPTGSAQAESAKAAVTTPATTATTTQSTQQATTTTPAAQTKTTTASAQSSSTASETPATTPAASTSTASTNSSSAAASASTAAKTTQSDATTSAAVAKSNVTTTSTKLKVNLPSGSTVATEWQDASYTSGVAGYADNGTILTAVSSLTAGGEDWYELSNGSYIPARYVTTNLSAGTSSATTTASASSSSANTVSTQSSAATATQSTASTSTTSAAKQTTTTPKQSTASTTTSTASTTTTNSASRSAKIAAVISLAKSEIGVNYVWGGKTPSGFDCSGLMYYVFLHAAGVNIGGWTVPQESSGTKISVGSAQPGDLLFWGSAGSTYHVALYLGGGQYLHAPQPGETVKIASLSQYFYPSFAVHVNLN